jgi:hypothetical protein
MSETEHIKGKVKLIVFPKDYTFLDKVESLKKTHGLQENQYDLDDQFIDHYEINLISIHGQIYEILVKQEIDPYDDISRIRKMTSNTFEFEFRFYNGGTCFSEMLEDALDRLGVQ